MSRGVFVTGTDTGCGKTTVAVGVTAAFARRGLRVAAMKPCETGDGDDALRLMRACGRSIDASLVNPYRFALPAAPELAARREHAEVDIARIEAAYRSLAADADAVVVEGAGGLLVPLARGFSMADLATRLELPVLLVARTGLGTINHTLLSVEAIRRRGLRLLGVVFSQTNDRVGDEEAESLEIIVRDGELRSFGVLPCLVRGTIADEKRLAAATEASLAVDELLGAL